MLCVANANRRLHVTVTVFLQQLLHQPLCLLDGVFIPAKVFLFAQKCSHLLEIVKSNFANRGNWHVAFVFSQRHFRWLQSPSRGPWRID